MTPLLDVRDLGVSFPLGGAEVALVEGVSFSLERGSALGLVGESGSGKSLTALALLGLVDPPGRVSGSVRLAGRELVGLSERALEAVRGRRIGIVFQEPMTALNPVLTVGEQVAEPLARHRALGRREARARAEELLARVGIPAAAARMDSYPHELSGGMRQRALIAMALGPEPEVLIADEPTTALDASLQAQVIELLRAAQAERGTALVFISHDLGVVSQLCDEVAVLYAGQVVERAPREALFAAPAHPYTQGLLAALPDLDRAAVPRPIPGTVPDPARRAPGCRFAARCPRVVERCRTEAPELVRVGGRPVRCHLAGS